MNRKRILSALAVALLGIATSVPAFAYRGGHYHHRSHVHFGVFVGAPAYWYYPPPYYYYPPYYPQTVVVPATPPVYIERSEPAAAPEQAQGYWYYCPEAKAYYPYVKQCAGGWQRVTPQPPS